MLLIGFLDGLEGSFFGSVFFFVTMYPSSSTVVTGSSEALVSIFSALSPVCGVGDFDARDRNEESCGSRGATVALG